MTGTCELYLGGLASYLFWYDSAVQLCSHLHLWAFLEIMYLQLMPSYTVQSANQSGNINRTLTSRSLGSRKLPPPHFATKLHHAPPSPPGRRSATPGRGPPRLWRRPFCCSLRRRPGRALPRAGIQEIPPPQWEFRWSRLTDQEMLHVLVSGARKSQKRTSEIPPSF